MPSITPPEFIDSPGGATAGIRQWVSFEEFATAIQAANEEVVEWLALRNAAPNGPFFIRYHVIDMPHRMEVEIGFFIDPGQRSEGRVTVSEVPAGRYANMRYIGDYDGLMNATAMLIGWAKETGVEWDAWDTPDGHAFAARIELYQNGPMDEPDPEKWITDIAIMVK